MCNNISKLENNRRFVDINFNDIETLDINLFLMAIKNNWNYETYLKERNELLDYIEAVPAFAI